MIEYRPFLNTDPPGLSQFWAEQPEDPLRIRRITPAQWESTVLARPYFDPKGLILAIEHDRPVGCAHAGFAGDAQRAALDRQTGLLCVLQVARRPDESIIADQLLRRAEQYVRRQGAGTLTVGSSRMACPFYMGLVGGTTNSGVVRGDDRQENWLRRAGFHPVRETSIYQRRLAGFRPAVDRMQMQLGRKYEVRLAADGQPHDWWNACTYGWGDCFCFELVLRAGRAAVGNLRFWDMEPLASDQSVHARGLIGLELRDELQTPDVIAFFLGQALKQLTDDGVTLAEVQAQPDCQPLVAVLGRLGFEQAHVAVSWSKPLDEHPATA